MSLTRRAVAAAAVAFLYLESLALSVALSETELDRRSLRRVHIGSPRFSPPLGASPSPTGGGLGVGAIIGIVVSCVCFVLVVAAAAVWGWRRKKRDPEWRLLGSFKRHNSRSPADADEEKLYAQAKGDTHLTAF